jgi:hypothetical protein
VSKRCHGEPYKQELMTHPLGAYLPLHCSVEVPLMLCHSVKELKDIYISTMGIIIGHRNIKDSVTK